LAGATAGVLGLSELSASSATTAAPHRQPPPWNHDPASPLGPGRWDAIGYPTCGEGARQSPVDIDTGSVVDLDGPPLVARYGCADLVVRNTGHAVEVPVPEDVGASLRIGADPYRLVQFHFHAPSEHRIDGRLADLEAHFVHQNSRGGIAVVGVHFQVGPDPNPLLTRILFSVPTDVDDEVPLGMVSPATLLPNLASFYSYRGSLTTPDCAEGVRWFLLADSGRVSAAAMERVHFVISRFPDYDGYADNNRPVQPLNGRVIGFRR
jgi:carbonic anhydrase